MTHRFSPVTLGERVEQFDAGAFALTEALYPPVLSLPRHAHGCATISFVLKGSCVETVGNSAHECDPYSPLLKPAGEVHSNRYGSSGAKCLLIEVKPHGLEMIRQFSEILDRVVYVQGGSSSGLAMRIYREFRLRDKSSGLIIEGLVLEMLGQTTRGQTSRALRLAPPRWLLKARDLCHEYFAQPISLIGVAESVGIHPSHLARTFRKYYRCTLGEYVRRLRLDYAARELMRSDKSLVEIASEAGFYDHSHFTHAFKIQMGMTPTDYRASVRERR